MTEALTLKVTLKRLTPRTWRRLVVRTDTTYAQLHVILQIAFGWDNSHLHSFTPAWNRRLAYEPAEYMDDDTFSKDSHGVAIYPDLQKGSINYTYDFGEDWQHIIVLEKVGEAKHVPTCLTGRGHDEMAFLEDYAPDERTPSGKVDLEFINEQLDEWEDAGRPDMYEDFIGMDLDDERAYIEDAVKNMHADNLPDFDPAIEQVVKDHDDNGQDDLANFATTAMLKLLAHKLVENHEGPLSALTPDEWQDGIIAMIKQMSFDSDDEGQESTAGMIFIMMQLEMLWYADLGQPVPAEQLENQLENIYADPRIRSIITAVSVDQILADSTGVIMLPENDGFTYNGHRWNKSMAVRVRNTLIKQLGQALTIFDQDTPVVDAIVFVITAVDELYSLWVQTLGNCEPNAFKSSMLSQLPDLKTESQATAAMLMRAVIRQYQTATTMSNKQAQALIGEVDQIFVDGLGLKY